VIPLEAPPDTDEFPGHAATRPETAGTHFRGSISDRMQVCEFVHKPRQELRPGAAAGD